MNPEGLLVITNHYYVKLHSQYATGNNYTTEKGEIVEIELTKFPEVFIFTTPELFHSSYNWWEPYLPNT